MFFNQFFGFFILTNNSDAHRKTSRPSEYIFLNSEELVRGGRPKTSDTLWLMTGVLMDLDIRGIAPNTFPYVRGDTQAALSPGIAVPSSPSSPALSPKPPPGSAVRASSMLPLVAGRIWDYF